MSIKDGLTNSPAEWQKGVRREEYIERRRKMAKQKIAVVTYNRVGEGQYDNGIVEGQSVTLFIAQNGHKSKWAAHPDGRSSEKEETRMHVARSVAKMVNLADMDHVYVYVGSNGGEAAISETRELPAEKVTYVMCSCNWGCKKNMIARFGHTGAQVIECECGGRETLAMIVKDLLKKTAAA